MGYSTDFEGSWTVTPPLKAEHKAYLKAFADTRRMKRDAAKTALRPDPVRAAVGLPVGDEGGYFVNEDGFAGQHHGPDVLDSNEPPAGQPGLWCKWEPTEAGDKYEWNGVEKFYDYVEWLEYVIRHFLNPWGYILKGRVDWQGEEEDDTGFINVYNNTVYVNTDPVLDRLAAEL
jgi:hypothetical protein